MLGLRRPSPFITLLGAVIGSSSHIFIDGFTHNNWWGANLFGLNDVVLSVPLKGPMTGADILQYLGHSLGSLAFLYFLWFVARRRKLEEWYGTEAVARARAVEVTIGDRLLFAALVIGPTMAAALLAMVMWGRVAFETLTALALAVLLAGTVLGRRQPLDRGDRPTSQDRAASQAPHAS